MENKVDVTFELLIVFIVTKLIFDSCDIKI